LLGGYLGKLEGLQAYGFVVKNYKTQQQAHGCFHARRMKQKNKDITFQRLDLSIHNKRIKLLRWLLKAFS
jgi:hypothetical protein